MGAVIEMPVSESYSVVTPLDARRVLESGPRFGDVRHINAHRMLELYELAARCTSLQGFCTCPYGCYNRAHWGARVSRSALERMEREQLIDVVERLRELGYVTRAEIREVMFWNC